MSQDKLNPVDGAGATLLRKGGIDEQLGDIAGTYRVSCWRVQAKYRQRAEELLADIVKYRAEGAAAYKLVEAEMFFGTLPREEVWAEEIHNIVTTVGKNLTLDTILGGSGYTASAAMGLKGVGTAVVGDTMASHASWTEVGGTNAPAYTGNRPVPAFSASASGVKQTSTAVVYTFTSSGTVAGCFVVLAGSTTKDNTTGTLLSAGDFSGGNKSVANTDVLNVTYSLAL